MATITDYVKPKTPYEGLSPQQKTAMAKRYKCLWEIDDPVNPDSVDTLPDWIPAAVKRGLKDQLYSLQDELKGARLEPGELGALVSAAWKRWLHGINQNGERVAIDWVHFDAGDQVRSYLSVDDPNEEEQKQMLALTEGLGGSAYGSLRKDVPKGNNQE